KGRHERPPIRRQASHSVSITSRALVEPRIPLRRAAVGTPEVFDERPHVFPDPQSRESLDRQSPRCRPTAFGQVDTFARWFPVDTWQSAAKQMTHGYLGEFASPFREVWR